ncbi:MAG: TonB-dependent receptor [Prolixibacteraceae bacterium]|nr:TonB-dependent receptor [Prolixibacteraceae bacterium]MBN2649616.1 TonB-dependent receptor [Prolixibacteraceae bacterium]
MIRFLLITLFASISLSGIGQNTISGVVTDAQSGETLIGANILIEGTSVGTATDINGEYSLSLENGSYTLLVSYVGYDNQTREVSVNNNDIKVNFVLESQLLIDEVKVVADVARSRETPVAFSTLTPEKLQEVIAAQDIPMVLNSTPGVYATTEGGGDGDAQVTIRGFSSRNVGVLLDGVPVNDMETGHVYWSNWFGLDAVTRSIQVQRGLGASKLALPSVGGTINIITKGMDSRKGGSIKQELGSDGYTRTDIGYTSGEIGNGWGFSVAGSYKQGNGWVDQTWTKGFFYYFKVDKRLGNHTLSLSGYGAPQSHAQRSYMLSIQNYDAQVARELGVPEEDIEAATPMGIRYNQHWGYLARTKDNPNAESKPFSERVNEYHKPQFTLKDSWNVNEHLFISNIAYLSIGNGGGVRAKSTPSTNEETRQMNFQTFYDKNISDGSINLAFDDQLHAASNYMIRRVNSHRWFGLLSTLNYEINDLNTFSGGIDLRSYRGIHYEEVYDLMGADYAVFDYITDWDDATKSKYMLKEGDKNNYHNDGFVRWGGLFGQWEYNNDILSSFINLTVSNSGYQRADYILMRKTSDVEQRDDFNYETIDGNLVEFTDWKWFPGYTAKGGANYNFTKRMNAFANLGYLSKAPRFNNVFSYDNVLFYNFDNEIVKAFELGYSYNSTIFSANLNAYYTIWENKPMDSATKKSVETSPGEYEEFSLNIKGMDALHKGVELDFIFKVNEQIDIQGLISVGDWRWNSSDSVRIYDDNQNLLTTEFFDATGVHVGNSAQTQIAGEIRWEPFDGLYFKPRVTYFADYYAEFDPISLDGTPDSYEWYNEETGEHGNARDSWRIPPYMIFDFHAGYRFELFDQRFQLRANMLNVLDKKRIVRAENNSGYIDVNYTDFDAKSAGVFFGLGRTYNFSLKMFF